MEACPGGAQADSAGSIPVTRSNECPGQDTGPGLGLIVPGHLLIFRAISGQPSRATGGNVYPFPKKLTVRLLTPCPTTLRRNNCLRRPRELSVLRRGTDQIPFVASDVEEHRDAAIGLGTRCAHELDTGTGHPRIDSTEVLYVEEETDPASSLPPDGSGLIFSISPGQQQAGHCAWRPDHYPSFGAPVIGQRRGVLHELEAQRVHEEPDRWVILADHDGDETKMHHASIGSPGCSPTWRLTECARTDRWCWAVGPLPGREAERFRMGPAVVLGQDVTEAARPVGNALIADLAACHRKMGHGHREPAGT